MASWHLTSEGTFGSYKLWSVGGGYEEAVQRSLYRRAPSFTVVCAPRPFRRALALGFSSPQRLRVGW